MSGGSAAAPGHYLLAVRGECLPNPGPGGWAAEIWRGGEPVNLLEGGEPHTTPQRMELVAACAAVGAVPAGAKVSLMTTLSYLDDGLNKWAPGWERRGLLGPDAAAGRRVKHRDLWARLLAACAGRDVSCARVPRERAGGRYDRVCAAAARMRAAAAEGPDAQAADCAREIDPEVLIYTDGSCLENPGPGGWAAVLVRGDRVERITGHEPETTNNRMEMRAVIEALKRVAAGVPSAVHTDSTYVQQGMTQWCAGWIAKGWLGRGEDSGARKKAVKNADLWRELLATSAGRPIAWKWVRGHDGDKYNEMAHELALGAARAGAPAGA